MREPSSRILYISREKKKFSSPPRNRRRIRLLLTIVCIAVLGAGAITFLRLPALQITSLLFTGLESIQEVELRAAFASEQKGMHFFFVPKTSYFFPSESSLKASLLRSFPLIASVEIKKEFPDRMQIAIRERKLFGILCNDAVWETFPKKTDENQILARETPLCAYLDTEGYVYQRSPASTGFLITKIQTDDDTIPIGTSAVDADTMTRLTSLRETLPSHAHSQVTGFTLLRSLPSEIRARVADGYTIMFQKDSDVSSVLSVLETVLTKEIGAKRRALDYIDLRHGNKVFYKFK